MMFSIPKSTKYAATIYVPTLRVKNDIAGLKIIIIPMIRPRTFNSNER